MTDFDYEYKRVLSDIRQNGYRKGNRTGVDTTSLPGQTMRVSLANDAVPLLTTKRVAVKTALGELLWMVRGLGTLDFLHDNNVNIWDPWADDNGDLGRVYGVQWRHWRRPDGTEVDQLEEVIRQLKETPDSRRIIISAWNPGEIDEMALPPCPTMIQFIVNPDENGELTQIDTVLTQRSADMFLGVPFDIFAYGVLTHFLARETGLKARSLTWTGGDCHIYENHEEQVDTLLGRQPIEGPSPTISFAEGAPRITDLEVRDVLINGYSHHGTLKGAIAV